MRRVEQELNYWEKEAKGDAERAVCDPGLTKSCLEAVMMAWKKDPMLEIGCGIGRLAEPLAEQGHDVTGVDISPTMIAKATEKPHKAEYYVNNGRSLPLPDEAFGFVYSVAVFQHIDLYGIAGYIMAARRVLERGGRLRFQFIEGGENEPFSKHYPLLPLTRYLENMDFAVVAVDKGLVYPEWTWITAVSL